jgi:hypothetical protein
VGKLTLGMEPAMVEVRFLVQRATIPSKRVILTFINTTHAINIMYVLAVLYKKYIYSPLEVKNN